MGHISSKGLKPGQSPQDAKMEVISHKLDRAQLSQLGEMWRSTGETRFTLLQFSTFIASAQPVFPNLTVLQEPEFAEQLFQLLDVDHNGFITHGEMFGGLALLVRGDVREKAGLAFQFADTNCDGKLTNDELQRALRTAMYHCQILMTMALAKAQYGHLFSTPGVDAYSIVKQKAVESANEFVGKSAPLIATMIEKMFAADTNRDGVITMEEWMNSCEVIPEIRAFFKTVTGMKLVPQPRDYKAIAAMNFGVSEQDQQEATAAAHKS